MGCRACAPRFSSGNYLHRERKRLSCTSQRHSDIYTHTYEGHYSHSVPLTKRWLILPQFHPTILLAGANTGVHIKGGEAAYSQYVRHLEKTSPAVMAAQKSGTVENFAQGYQDYLQAPLQVSPLPYRKQPAYPSTAPHG